MRDPALLFALLAGVAAATYTVFVKLASTSIHPVMGAIVVTLSALVVNVGMVLVLRARGQEILVTLEGAALLVVAGIAAAAIDVFSLLAYGRGLKVSSSLVITGAYTALVLLVGILALKEPLSWTKLLALLLIATGIVLLQRQGV